jgi:hypothetical protein
MSTTTRYRQTREYLEALRVIIGAEDGQALRHPDQAHSAYWQAADLQVIPNESFEHVDAFATHQLLIFTPHAETLSWMLYMLRDAFADYLTPDNKSLIYSQWGVALKCAQASRREYDAQGMQSALLDAADLALEAFLEAEQKCRRRKRG